MTALFSAIVKTTTADSSLRDAGAWAAIAAAVIALLLLLAGLVQWYRRWRRIQTLTRLIDSGVSVRRELAVDKPDADVMQERLNEWLSRVQDDVRKRAPHALPDVQAAVVESLPTARMSGFSSPQGDLLMRFDHVMRALRRYVQG